MKKLKKILVTGMTKNLGGVEKFIVNYCQKIMADDIKFDFIVTDDKCVLENEIKEMNSKIYYITEKHFKHPIKFRKQLEEYVKDEYYDAIWVNDCSLNTFHYIKIAKKIGIPTRIIHSHNSRNMDTSLKGMIRYLIHLLNKYEVSQYATHYWACSDLAAKFFYTSKIMPYVTIINNGIETQKFKFDLKTREEYRKKLNFDDKFIIGNVGRLHFQKNQLYLLKIFKEYLKDDLEAKLVLIGEGQDRYKIEQYMEENDLKDKVVLLGICNNVNDIMQAMDIFLLPSLFEGLPIVGIEAQCSGLPCIFSANITKNVKLLKDTCFLGIKDEDIEKWVKKIQEMRDEKIDRKQAEQIIKRKGYDINVETDKLRTFFREQ